MGALTSLWIPSFALGHILGLVFLLYALEKINGSLTRFGKLVSRVATSRGRTKDAPSPTSEAGTPSAGAGAAGKGAALAKERAASLKQTSLYADDGLNSNNADGAVNGDGIDSDGGANPAATTPAASMEPRLQVRGAFCFVFSAFWVEFCRAPFRKCDRTRRNLSSSGGREAKEGRKGSRAPSFLMGGSACLEERNEKKKNGVELHRSFPPSSKRPSSRLRCGPSLSRSAAY